MEIVPFTDPGLTVSVLYPGGYEQIHHPMFGPTYCPPAHIVAASSLDDRGQVVWVINRADDPANFIILPPITFRGFLVWATGHGWVVKLFKAGEEQAYANHYKEIKDLWTGSAEPSDSPQL